jgi:hypothetical protein
MDLQSIFHQVSGLLNDRTRQNDSVDTDGLLGQVAGIFRQNGYQGEDYRSPHMGGYNGQQVLPASMDPLGDPADQQGFANQAAYGGQQGYGNQPGYVQSDADRQAGILPASQDPLGDPADQQSGGNRW